VDIQNKMDRGTEESGLCPKCGKYGISRENDIYGSFYECIYCGYTKDIIVKTPKVSEIAYCINGDNNACELGGR